MSDVPPGTPPGLVPWKPGQSGNPSGKPKKLVRRLEETLHAAGLDPMREILKLIEDNEISKNTKLKTWLEILPYMYPKAREQQSPADDVRDILAALSNEELMKRMESAMTAMKKSA